MTNFIYRFLADASVNVPDSSGQNTPYHTGLPTVSANYHNVQVVLEFTFAILGMIALIMMIIAGLRFIISSGDPQDVSTARNTLIYAAVGLVICVSAEAIVTFILKF